MNPNFDHSKYFASALTESGERPDISHNFEYLKQSEVDYCKQKIAVKIVQLNFARDTIITSIQDARATTGTARWCLQTRGDKITRVIRILEIKFDELSTPNFPICRLFRKTRIGRFFLPEGVTVYLTKFQKKESAPHTPVEPDLLAEATGGISPIPRITEEIKWRPTVETEANTSIFDSVDEFIRLPVDGIIQRLQEEQRTGTPDLRDRARFLDQLWRKELSPKFDWNNYSAELSEATGFRGWDSDDDTLSESNCSLVIEEWFKIAERTARLAGWNEEQKIAFFQEKLSKSAANFNDSLTAQQRDVYAAWKALLIAGLHDNTTKAIKKGELKDLKQEPGERVRDFQTRIDDMYRIAYGAGPVTSNDANVVLVRDDMKKEILLAGLRREIATLVWNRVEADKTYANTVDTAIECEKVTEIKKTAQSKDITSAVSVISQENEKNAARIGRSNSQTVDETGRTSDGINTSRFG
ncbi:hypothetical protein DAPPUDRAFT_120189 [Daphnia pulex]|uniref:Uncharacterized protein n=1 Tax=Daphnia pulex TaxID=6669 RepID=E9I0K5_DAPPU|nr:hypothetical protein DAPPUDRAFT_120189 [Daphnia pulex]|eukprot:EFX62475.1 hypothetical protein DAPPUDRAFT_120189 [Daphnia pulex]